MLLLGTVVILPTVWKLKRIVYEVLMTIACYRQRLATAHKKEWISFRKKVREKLKRFWMKKSVEKDIEIVGKF